MPQCNCAVISHKPGSFSGHSCMLHLRQFCFCALRKIAKQVKYHQKLRTVLKHVRSAGILPSTACMACPMEQEAWRSPQILDWPLHRKASAGPYTAALVSSLLGSPHCSPSKAQTMNVPSDVCRKVCMQAHSLCQPSKEGRVAHNEIGMYYQRFRKLHANGIQNLLV